MSEALARVRNDSVLTRPARAPRRGGGVLALAAARVRGLPVRFYAGSAFAALLVGIVVNALLLQRERRPAPSFAPAHQTHSQPGPANPAPLRGSPPPVEAAPAASTPAPATSLPPQRPTTAVEAPATGAPDPIGKFLRDGGDAHGDSSRAVEAAQSALVKLGYPVKADGVRGTATDQALRDFERLHGLPVSTELTPRLLKQLASAARATGR
jgi:hypothetical protein